MTPLNQKLHDAVRQVFKRLGQCQDPDTDELLETAIEYFIAIEIALETYERSRLIQMLEDSRPIPREFLPMVAEVLGQAAKKPGRRPVMTSTREFYECMEIAFRMVESGDGINLLSVDIGIENEEKGIPLGSEQIRRIFNLHKSHPLIQDILNLNKEHRTESSQPP